MAPDYVQWRSWTWIRSCLMPSLTVLGVVLVVMLSVRACATGYHAPRGVGGCNHMFTIGDAGTGIGLDWDTKTHPYGRDAAIYVCAGDQSGATVTIEAPPNVWISTSQIQVNAPSLVLLLVSPHQGAHGSMRFTFLYPGGKKFGDAGLPEIVAGSHGWHFAKSNI